MSNIDGSKDANIDLQQEGKYFVPAWSVSILEGCNKEIYNTAKVNVQTSIMVKKPLTATASWSWTPEIMKDTLHGKGNFTASKLLDQKQASSESSDYLWYTTRYDNLLICYSCRIVFEKKNTLLLYPQKNAFKLFCEKEIVVGTKIFLRVKFLSIWNSKSFSYNNK